MQSVPPQATLKRFSCPNCHAFADQQWFRTAVLSGGGVPFYAEGDQLRPAGAMTIGPTGNAQIGNLPSLTVTRCASCSLISLWSNSEMIYPRESFAPPANPDLPAECRQDYDEAAAIMVASPRGSAALLRLAIQKLCLHLGGKGANINDDIGFLVKERGLPEPARHALDSIRVVGNNAVHPGEMNVEDTPDVVLRLFAALNFVVQTTITVPKEMSALYGAIPAGAQAAADKRDGRGPT